jgi:hypothetical protein
MPTRLRLTFRTMSYRATLAAKRSGASAQATRQAAGVPSAGSQSPNPPPRDHADGATLGSLRSGGDSEGRCSRSSSIPIPMKRPEQRQLTASAISTSRPAPRDAVSRSFRKRQAPSLQNCLCFREGSGCPPQNPLSLAPLTSRKRNHCLESLRRRTRHDLAPPPPHTISEPHRRQPRWLSLHHSMISCSDRLPACRSVSISSREPLQEV